MVSIGISVSVGTNAVTRVPKGTTVTIRASCTWETEYPRRLWIAIDQDPNGNVTDPAWVRELYDTDRPAGGALLEGQMAVNLVGTWGFKAYFKWMDEEGGYHTLGPAGWALEVYEPPPPPPPPPEPQPPPPEPGLKITVRCYDYKGLTEPDPYAYPIAGADVKVCSLDFNYKWKGKTNSRGICVTPDLAEGIYMVIVGKKGYDPSHGYVTAGQTSDWFLPEGTYPSLKTLGITPQPAKPGQYVSFFGWAYGIDEGATITFEIFGTDSLWHSVASTTMGPDVGYGTDWLVPSECYGRKPGEDWRFRAKSGATVSGEVTLTVIGVVKHILAISAGQGGTTDPAPGTYQADEGSQISVTALASQGWKFDHWLLDGGTRTENPTIVTMDADHSLEAHFSQIQAETGTLEIHAYLDSQEVGASVSISGVGSYTTPVTLAVPAGTYTVGASYGGLPQTKTAQVAKGQTTLVVFQYQKKEEEKKFDWTTAGMAAAGLFALLGIALLATAGEEEEKKRKSAHAK